MAEGVSLGIPSLQKQQLCLLFAGDFPRTIVAFNEETHYRRITLTLLRVTMIIFPFTEANLSTQKPYIDKRGNARKTPSQRPQAHGNAYFVNRLVHAANSLLTLEIEKGEGVSI